MYRFGFIVPCDIGSFAGLRALLGSISYYHPECPVFIYEGGFGAAELKWLFRHTTRPQVFKINDLPYASAGLWEARQQVLAHCIGKVRCGLLLSPNIVLTSSVDALQENAEKGHIVIGTTGEKRLFQESHSVFSALLPKQEYDVLYSGFVCLDLKLHWELLGLWAFSSTYAQYSPHRGTPLALPGAGDGDIFTALIYALKKRQACHFVPLTAWAPLREGTQIRIEKADGEITRVADCNDNERLMLITENPKWWTKEGREKYQSCGQGIECFEHFSNRSGTYSMEQD